MPTTSPDYNWPIPSSSDAPDGPGAFYALAQAIGNQLLRRVSLWKSASQALNGATVTAVIFDVTKSDPSGLMAPTDGGYSVRLPWAGRYRTHVRWGFTGSNSTYAQTEFYVNGTSISKTARAALSGVPMADSVEFAANAGDTIQVRVYTTESDNRGFTIGDDTVRPKWEVAYLGPR